MASNFYVQEAANLFCGDHDPSASKHLTLTEMQLPTLQEMYQDHHAGGAIAAIDIAVGIEKLEATFRLGGTDPDLLGMFGLGSRRRNTFTSYGVIRDQRTGNALESKAIIEGRLGSIEPEAFQRGELQGHNYGINGIVHYELWFAGREKFYWDFFTGDYRIDGRAENSDEQRILRIGSAV